MEGYRFFLTELQKYLFCVYYKKLFCCCSNLFFSNALATSAEEMMKKCVSWDTERHLSFAVPFADMKPVIYLDLFLPRVTDLALSASDRQTKVLMSFLHFCLC